MYFDAVLDEKMRPLFNGTRRETKKWLEENPPTSFCKWKVCIGTNMECVPVEDYLART